MILPLKLKISCRPVEKQEVNTNTRITANTRITEGYEWTQSALLTMKNVQGRMPTSGNYLAIAERKQIM